MPDPKKKAKIPKVKPPVRPVYDYTRYGQPWQQPLGATPGARNMPFTITDPTMGTPPYRPLTGTPGGTPWTATPTRAGTKVPWGKLAGSAGTLGKLGGWAGLLSLPFMGWQARQEQLALQPGAEEFARKELGLLSATPPTPPIKLTKRTKDIMAKLGVTPEELMAMSPAERTQFIQDALSSGKLTDKVLEEGISPAVSWGTTSQGGWDYQIGYDKEGNIVSQDALGRTELPAGQLPPRETYEEWGVDPGENWHFNPNTGKWEFLPPEGYISPAERERMDLERDVFEHSKLVRAEETKLEREKYGAQLRANPGSWLEYAAFKGETPAIQPWMMPLMPQQYAGLQAGGEIPGYQAGGQSMNLPQLTTPSSQYMSRISPSARSQYMGYEQARTGATPEDISWRLWSQAPPGGRYPGLRRMR